MNVEAAKLAASRTGLSLLAGREASRPGSPGRMRAAIRGTAKLGAVFPMLVFWLFFEFGRPSQPFKLPLLISTVACTGWLLQRDRQWSPHTWAFFVFLGVIVLGVPIASNNHSALVRAQDMTILLLTAVLPLQASLTTVRRVRIWTNALVAVCFYVAAWGFFHEGQGPAGGMGSQDENYVSAMIGMAVPFAYFAAMAEKRLLPRVVFGLSVPLFCGSMVTQANPSRGGFLGLCAVVLYCIWRSPRRLIGFGLLAGAGAVVAALAGPAYWAEISSSGDYKTGTGDVRLQLWQIGLRMWANNPIFGVGAGNFTWNLDVYKTAAQAESFGRELASSIIAHSLPIELVAELGTVGLIAVLVLVVGTWRQLGQVVDNMNQPGPAAQERRALGYLAEAVRASIVAVLVNGVFLSLLYYSNLWLLIAVGSAIPHIHRRVARGVRVQRALGNRFEPVGIRRPA